jgi:hypothetical protein
VSSLVGPWSGTQIARAVLAAAAVTVAAPAVAGAAAPVDYNRTGAYAWAAAPPDVNDVLTWSGVVEDAATGLPQVVYADGLAYWNPTTVALWGLQEFNRFAVHGRRKSLGTARKAGDWLVARQRADGSWRYRMTFTLARFAPIAPGWVAAQAQGNAISLLVRLHAATGDARYRRAAVRARLPYERPVADAGLRRRFMGRPMLEGFPTQQPSFALEDLQLALLGLYDLSALDPVARTLFRRYMETLVWALPYYEDDLGRPQFDLGHRTAGVAAHYDAGAHAFNAQMLALLGRLSGNAAARRRAARWSRLLAG